MNRSLRQTKDLAKFLMENMKKNNIAYFEGLGLKIRYVTREEKIVVRDLEEEYTKQDSIDTLNAAAGVGKVVDRKSNPFDTEELRRWAE